MFEKDDIILGLLNGLEYHTTVDFKYFEKLQNPEMFIRLGLDGKYANLRLLRNSIE